MRAISGHSRALVASCLITVGAGWLALPVMSASSGPADRPGGKLHPGLVAKQQDDARRTSSARAAERFVTVAALPTANGHELLRDLEGIGLVDGVATSSKVTGRLPVSAIDEAESLTSLRFVRPEFAVLATGSTTSQGDAALRADDARSNHGSDGDGVTVGTLSDSYDCLGGAATDKASNDLPSAVNVVLELECDGDATDEGRAMMQHVHDLAPGADQAFHTAFTGELGFAAGIHALAEAGADVIVDDVIYLGEPMFQDGAVAQAVDEVTADGVSYFSAAGNNGRASYESAFRDSGEEGAFGTEHDFGGGDTRQRVRVPARTTALVALQWDDPFLTAPGSIAGPESDVDLMVYDTNGNWIPLHSSTMIQEDTGEPVEVAVLENTTNGVRAFDLAIELFSGPEPGLLKWVGFHFDDIVEHDTESPTAYGHTNAASALSTGAAFWGETPEFGQTPAVRESYSSAGGIDILFGNNGERLAQPSERQTPDFVSVDGGNTTFFGTDIPHDLDAFPNFFGTSAAAPHAAAVAALALGRAGPASPSDVCNAFARTAIGMEASPEDTGHGFVDADAVVALLAAPGLTGPCTGDLGTVSATIDDAFTFEGDAVGFRIRLSEACTDGTATIPYSTRSFVDNEPRGTATEGEDYELAEGTVTFMPGDREKQASFFSMEDEIDEADETFAMFLGPPTGTCPVTIGRGEAEGTIRDDDDPAPGTPVLRVNDVSVVEGESASFAVTLSDPCPEGGSVTVPFDTRSFTTGQPSGSASEGIDYDRAAGSVTFDASQSRSAVVISREDALDEPSETFALFLGPPTGSCVVSPGDTIGVGTIVDDDAAPVGIDVEIDDTEGDEGDELSFRVELSAPCPPGQTARVSYGTRHPSTDQPFGTAIEDVDYEETSGTLTFEGSTVRRSFGVVTIDDEEPEDDETFSAFIHGVSGTCAATVRDVRGQATIFDDDEEAPAPTPTTPGETGRAEDLGGLRIAPESSRDGYSEDLFEHWIDADGDGCDTSVEVMQIESMTPITGRGCSLAGGTWFSPYDGVVTSDPSRLEVAHLVTLAEAWDSGADLWSPVQRRAFANDIANAPVLNAVTRDSNAAKGDSEPGEFLPRQAEIQCIYTVVWVQIKLAYDLAADADEVADLRRILEDTCTEAGADPGFVEDDDGGGTGAGGGSAATGSSGTRVLGQVVDSGSSDASLPNTGLDIGRLAALAVMLISAGCALHTAGELLGHRLGFERVWSGSGG